MSLLVILAALYGVKTDKYVTIIFTNDINGSLPLSQAYWVSLELPPDLGNAKSLNVLLNKERSKNEVILLNSGNLAPFNIPGEEKTPEELVCFLNELKFDASLIGTNELSYGSDFLYKLKIGTSTKFLSANLYGEQIRYIITTKNDLKIGIFGLTSPYALLFVPSRYRDEININLELGKVAKNVVDSLKERGAEIIIGLSDAGFRNDSIIAENVAGIDCIIGSGSIGRVLREPFETPTNHTLLTKAYNDLSSAGKLILYLDEDNNISGYHHELITLFLEEYPPYK
jgi:2',3'-cyclic-nucleotide 2'-phosphodiesterase (5'-nucleotidase family)